MPKPPSSGILKTLLKVFCRALNSLLKNGITIKNQRMGSKARVIRRYLKIAKNTRFPQFFIALAFEPVSRFLAVFRRALKKVPKSHFPLGFRKVFYSMICSL